MPEPPYAPPPVANYFVQSLLCTLCCCMPTGVVAMIFAIRVNQRLHGGDFVGAVEASTQAKIWCWISVALALIGWLAVAVGVVFEMMEA
jgi:hypothetical protein